MRELTSNFVSSITTHTHFVEGSRKTVFTYDSLNVCSIGNSFIYCSRKTYCWDYAMPSATVTLTKLSHSVTQSELENLFSCLL